MNNDMLAMSLCEIAEAIRKRKVSSLEVTEAVISRAQQLQTTLNGFIFLDAAQALNAARQADELQARGEATGPLHGIPLAHKDMFYRAGRASTCGSRLRKEFVPNYTSTVLSRLDEAGALDLGGLNMSEFACNPFGLNILVGRACNPWNPDYISGGSSSGSGVTVAARIHYGALGSDTGGSVRLPAAICGVVGLLPTNTRVSRYGVMPLSFSLDNAGPLARTVRDCARLTQVIAGFDPMDPTSSTREVPNYEININAPIKGVRIGLPVQHHGTRLASDVRAALEASIKVFREHGAEVLEIQTPEPEPFDVLANTIILSEAAAIHARWLREQSEEYTPIVRERLEFGFSFPAVKYVEALSLRGNLLNDYLDKAFTKVDVLHLPMLSEPVPTMASIEKMVNAGPDLSFNLAMHTRLFNYLGLPSLSIPCGFSNNGLPVGFQLVGAPFSEDRLFNLGHVFQSTTDHHRSVPDLLSSSTNNH